MAQPTMPIIPGLAGAGPSDDEEAAPMSGIQDALAALSDEDLAGLEQAAAAAKEAGELDEVLGGGADAVEGDEPEHDEQHETPEEELAESDEQQAEEEEEGEEDPTPHVRAAEDAAKAASTAFSELTKLVEDAGEHEKAGLDMDEIEDLLKEAEEANDEAESANEDAHGADAEEAAKCAETAQQAADAVVTALAAAKEKIAAGVKQATDEAVPDGVRAMTAWAKQTLGVG